MPAPDRPAEPSPAPEVGPEEAVRLIETGAHLLDVREDEEWRAGHAPTASHLPMGQLAARIAEVPADRTVVCVCRVGGRS
ncbi:MAG TPA: rhodanese-like domain-containing protein, partial [Acidimicrobiales bacterium]|nr:rhodanese-like domain-containing protein [Acidimicrobiales bacterium]